MCPKYGYDYWMGYGNWCKQWRVRIFEAQRTWCKIGIAYMWMKQAPAKEVIELLSKC